MHINTDTFSINIHFAKLVLFRRAELGSSILLTWVNLSNSFCERPRYLWIKDCVLRSVVERLIVLHPIGIKWSVKAQQSSNDQQDWLNNEVKNCVGYDCIKFRNFSKRLACA
jgi:hypothetical protein